jgi:hypothetical protein
MVKYTKNNKTIKLKVLMRTELFLQIRTPQRKKWMLKERYLYWKLRRKTQRVFSVTRPEVVLPTYMASAFGLDKVSLADIGTDGLDEKMQRRTLTINQK